MLGGRRPLRPIRGLGARNRSSSPTRSAPRRTDSAPRRMLSGTRGPYSRNTPSVVRCAHPEPHPQACAGAVKVVAVTNARTKVLVCIFVSFIVCSFQVSRFAPKFHQAPKLEKRRAAEAARTKGNYFLRMCAEEGRLDRETGFIVRCDCTLWLWTCCWMLFVLPNKPDATVARPTAPLATDLLPLEKSPIVYSYGYTTDHRLMPNP